MSTSRRCRLRRRLQKSGTEELGEVVVQAGKIERKIFFERRDWECNHA